MPRETIGYELVKLNACILVLGKIHAFPFHVFAPYREKSHFWELTSVCLFESAVLAIWKVAVDSQPDGLTLRQFKRDVLQNVCSEQVRLQLQDALRAVDFEKRLSGLEEKIRNLRHNVVAHWNRFWLNADAEARKERSVGLADLRTTAQVLDDLFHVLCFGSDFATLPIDYFLNKHNPDRDIDIDVLLGDIVWKSRVLKRPETDPEGWQELRAKMSPREIDVFNFYRKKFGLELV